MCRRMAGIFVMEISLQGNGLWHRAGGSSLWAGLQAGFMPVESGRPRRASRKARNPPDYFATFAPQTFSWMDLGTGS